MTIPDFLTALATDGKGPLADRTTLALLLQRASEGLSQPFLDACFQAKFLVRSQEVMRRIGRGAEGFDPMAAEFQAAVERTMTLLRTVVKEAPLDARDRFVQTYLVTDAEAFNRFLALCADLARIKNWEVDGRPLPFGPEAPPARASIPATSSGSLSGVLRASRVAFVMFILLLIIDGPASIVGWICALTIVGLFIIIEYAAAQHHNEQGV